MRKVYKGILLFTILSTSFLISHGQDTLNQNADAEKVFTIVDEMPQFPGGDSAMFSFIRETIRYPVEAQKNNIQGKIYVAFIVDTNGAIVDSKISRGIGGGCDEEAIRVINMMPVWTPGKQNGKHVKVSYTLPVLFKLNRMEIDSNATTEPLTIVDKMPEYPGGEDAMMRFLAHNIKYPPFEREKNIQGRVYIRFVVDQDGNVVAPVVIKGVRRGIDEEALRVVRLMPQWIPATQDGKRVSVYFNLPIRFTLK